MQFARRLFLLGLAFFQVVSATLLMAQTNPLQRLEKVLSELSVYQYGQPELWKPDMIEAMRLIYKDPELHEDAEKMLASFRSSNASSEARQAISRDLENLSDLIRSPSIFEEPTEVEVAHLLSLEKRTAQVNEDLLKFAEVFSKEGRKSLALTIYQKLLDRENHFPTRVAAMRGQFRISPEPVAYVMKAIQEADFKLEPHAIRLVSELPDTFEGGLKLLEIEGLDPNSISQLIKILAGRGDPSIHDFVVTYCSSENQQLRQIALESLRHMGKPRDVKFLAEIAADNSDPNRSLAREALYQMPGRKVDDTIVQLMATEDMATQIELIQAVEKRNIVSATKQLIKLSRTNPTVTSQTIKSLSAISPVSGLEAVIDLLTHLKSMEDRKALETAIYRIAARDPDDKEGKKIIQRKLGTTEDKSIRVVLSAILQKLE